MTESNSSYIYTNGTDTYQNDTVTYQNGTSNFYQNLRYPVAIEVFWQLGIGTSTLCLIIQIFLYILIPSSRKVDQKILTQMTVARLLNVIFEFFVSHPNLIHSTIVRDAVFSLYQQTDAALICWMFVFTKNIHDKVIIVFNTKPHFVLISVAVWIVTLPIGILCPFLLNYNLFDPFYKVYGVIKFFILSVNLLLFCIIFWIAVIRKKESNDGGKGFLRTFIVALILVTITSLQVFVTDVMSFADDNSEIGIIFCVVNSYEAVAMTILFVILVGGVKDSVRRLIQKILLNQNGKV